jgi:hypothetical protein
MEAVGDAVARFMADERERTDKLVAELRQELALLRSNRAGADEEKVISVARGAWTRRGAA